MLSMLVAQRWLRPQPNPSDPPQTKANFLTTEYSEYTEKIITKQLFFDPCIPCDPWLKIFANFKAINGLTPMQNSSSQTKTLAVSSTKLVRRANHYFGEIAPLFADDAT
jgi:hypothetical protein